MFCVRFYRNDNGISKSKETITCESQAEVAAIQPNMFVIVRKSSTCIRA